MNISIGPRLRFYLLYVMSKQEKEITKVQEYGLNLLENFFKAIELPFNRENYRILSIATKPHSIFLGHFTTDIECLLTKYQAEDVRMEFKNIPDYLLQSEKLN